jgi:DNA-binding CsgD family transcriptional regulator
MLPALEPIAQHKQLAQQSSRFSAMLDSLRIPMALIDTSQRMLAANASARQMFDLSARSSSGRIVIALPGVSPIQFAQLIRGACGTPAIGGVLPVQFSPASAGAHVLVMPLQNQHLTQQKPAALVLVQGLAIASVHAHQLLQHLYRLTPAEARLAVLILDGQSPSRVASALQLSVTTVRTQLSAVLKKTGAQRQSDLVRRLAPLMLLEKHLAAS